MGGEQGNFVIQLTPELIRQLIQENSEPKPPRRRRRSKAATTGGDDKPSSTSLPFGMPPPLFPMGFPRALRHPDDGDKQQDEHGFKPEKELDISNVESSKEEIDQQKSDQAVASRNLKPLIDVLQKTEKFSEELQKRSVEELEELKQRSAELRAKHHYDSPPRTVPCVAERDECIKCYKEGEPLRCSSVAAAYIQCAMKALRGQ